MFLLCWWGGTQQLMSLFHVDRHCCCCGSDALAAYPRVPLQTLVAGQAGKVCRATTSAAALALSSHPRAVYTCMCFDWIHGSIGMVLILIWVLLNVLCVYSLKVMHFQTFISWLL
jgi:hypothetical protein